jgi:hypothetical protein
MSDFKKYLEESTDMDYNSMINHITKIETLLRDVGFNKYLRNIDKTLGTKILKKVDKILKDVTSITDDAETVNFERMI